MYRYKRLISVLVVGIMFAGLLAACTTATPVVTEEPEEPKEVTEEPTEEVVVEEPTEEVVEEPTFEEQPFGENLPTEPTIDTPLVVAYNNFSQKFSPFFAESGYDFDVEAMTQIALLTTDRVGGIISNAIEGETRNYNGVDHLYKGPADTSVVYDEATDTTKYTAKLRVGMKFSDGEPVTADDVIFTYYTYLDPSYVGSSSLSSFDIVGLKDYMTQTTSEVYDKYDEMFEAIYAAGVDHEWTEEDAWTQEQQDDFWTRMDAEFLYEAGKIVNYVKENYSGFAVDYAGYPFEEIEGIEGMEVMFGMVMWASVTSVMMVPLQPDVLKLSLTWLNHSQPWKTMQTKSTHAMRTMFKKPSPMSLLTKRMYSQMSNLTSLDIGVHWTNQWATKAFRIFPASSRLTITPWK